jgi:DNA-binding protein HU-beta
MKLNRIIKPLGSHLLVLFLAACGSLATLETPQCDSPDGLDDADLYESESISAQAVTVPSVPDTYLVDTLDDRTTLTRKQSGEAVAVLFDLVVEALKDNKKVNMPGLGTVTPKVRPARIYRNPKTGELIPRPAAAYVSYKMASTLKGNLTQPPQ